MQNFEIVQRNSGDVLDLLRRGEVNAGITSRPLSISGVASYSLPPMEIVACASPSNGAQLSRGSRSKGPASGHRAKILSARYLGQGTFW